VRIGTGAVGLVALVAVLGVSPADAQEAEEASPADVAQARELFYRGVELLRGSEWEAACEALARSNALVETPHTRLNLAVCSGEIGRLVEQSEHLRAVLRLGEGELDAERLADARSTLEDLEPRIPRVVVRVVGAVDDVEVRVDDRIVPPAGWGAERPADPGTVTVHAEAPGYLPFTEEIEIAQGERREVEVRMVPSPDAAAASGADTSGSPADGGDAGDGGAAGGGAVTGRWWFWAIVGVVVLGGGAATYLALSSGGTAEPEFPPGTPSVEALRLP